METIIIELINFFKELIENKKLRNKKYLETIFNTKVSRCNNLINETHNDYISSLLKYIDYIESNEKLNKEIFMKLTSKIVKDMIASEQYRISLSVTTTTDKLNDKVNESFKFFFSQYESYISLINDYLQYKKNSIPTIYGVHPCEKVRCTNVIRRRLIYDLESEYDKDANKNKKIRLIMISKIEELINELNEKFQAIQTKYETLENIIIKMN